MPLPTSLLAFEPEMQAFSRADSAEKGIRVEFPEERKARSFIARLHQARVLDRRENLKAYKEGDPMYGKSAFDGIRVSLREDTEGNHWVYLEKMENIPGAVEEL